MTQPLETIASSGYPLGFKYQQGGHRPGLLLGQNGRAVFTVQARHLTGSHQKEAIVTEGDQGSAWRMVSDEGVHIKGDDLAPFPLGFFNVGLQADLANRLHHEALRAHLECHAIQIICRTGYSMAGSFFRGDGVGYASPPTIELVIDTPTSDVILNLVVKKALAASPAIALLTTPLLNSFSLTVNGCEQRVKTLPSAMMNPEIIDPFKRYPLAPAPQHGLTTLQALIEKTGQKRSGTPSLTAPAATATQRIEREVEGRCTVDMDRLLTQSDVALQLPGMSHFSFKTDESAADLAPSGLALMSAGIAFCYMTQLSRYIDYLGYKIRHLRLVQQTPFNLEHSGAWVEPVHTHLFFEGEESSEIHENFMRISALTCFLHATLSATLHPIITVRRGPVG